MNNQTSISSRLMRSTAAFALTIFLCAPVAAQPADTAGTPAEAPAETPADAPAAADAAAAPVNQFIDPLDVPSRMVSKPEKRAVMALVKAGNRLVAVGPRGMIILSDDDGATWRQVQAPVQSDFLAIHFPTPEQGWIVGHDSLVLHTADAGETWTVQLSYREAAPQFREYYQKMIAAGVAGAEAALARVEVNFNPDTPLPFLDVCFEDTQRGYATGSYGILAATQDGGKTWQPWFDHIENPDGFNLNSVESIGGEIYIAGEKGMVFKLDRAQQRFVGVSSGYDGSFFGITGAGTNLLAYGLRGNIYSSSDAGQTWASHQAASISTISGGNLTPSGNKYVLVNSAGQLVVGDRSSLKFELTSLPQVMRLTSVLPVSDETVVVAGLEGVRREQLTQPVTQSNE